MSDTEFDVVIAAYMVPELAQEDFDALVKLVQDEQLEVEGLSLIHISEPTRQKLISYAVFCL